MWYRALSLYEEKQVCHESTMFHPETVDECLYFILFTYLFLLLLHLPQAYCELCGSRSGPLHHLTVEPLPFPWALEALRLHLLAHLDIVVKATVRLQDIKDYLANQDIVFNLPLESWTIVLPTSQALDRQAPLDNILDLLHKSSLWENLNNKCHLLWDLDKELSQDHHSHILDPILCHVDHHRVPINGVVANLNSYMEECGHPHLLQQWAHRTLL